MTDTLEFHPVHVAVRPTRAAVRMGTYDGWEHSALRILEFLSVTWGGAGDIIVTAADDGSVADAIWAAAELYDADVWASHVNTHRGYQLKDAEGYETFLQTEAEKWADKHEWSIEHAREQLHDMFMRQGSWNGYRAPETFWNRTRAFNAPAWDSEFGHPLDVRADEMPGNLLVDVTKLSPLPNCVLVAETEGLSMAARVLIASQFGALSAPARTVLQGRGVRVEGVRIADKDLRRIVLACWNAQTALPDNLRKAIVEALGLDAEEPSPIPTLESLRDQGPFALSMVGLRKFQRSLPIHDDWPLAIVVGDKADDFALAMALDRCLGPALWIPPEILGEDTMTTVVSALMTGWQRNDHDRNVHVTSCSLDAEVLEPIRHRLTEGLYDGPGRVRVSFPIPLPERRPVIVADTQHFSRIDDEQFVGDTTARGIRATLPSSVESAVPFDLSWWVDVVRFDHELPSRWPLNQHLVARSGNWRSRARVTRGDGLSFNSHPLGFLSAGQRLDQLVDNPRLRFLGAEAIFEALASPAGLRLAESPAGLFAARVIDLWGGWRRLVADLRRPLVRRVLDAYQSTAKSGETPGNMLVDRRVLSYADLESVAGDAAQELRTFIDQLLNSGVLRRGVCLKCDYCRNFGWYDADDTGQAFRCGRCRTEAVIDSHVVRGVGPEPAWYYALAEVAYQAQREHFHVPLLALDEIAGKAPSVLVMTEHELFFDDDSVEIDLWAVIDGRIVLGEANTSGELGADPASRTKKVRRLRRAADALTADRLVLATAASSWTPGSTDAIYAAFQGSRAEVDLLVHVDPHLRAVAPTEENAET